MFCLSKKNFPPKKQQQQQQKKQKNKQKKQTRDAQLLCKKSASEHPII